MIKRISILNVIALVILNIPVSFIAETMQDSAFENMNCPGNRSVTRPLTQSGSLYARRDVLPQGEAARPEGQVVLSVR